MKEKVKVAAVQICPKWLSPKDNLDLMKEKIIEASQEGADLIVFPELSNTGYITKRNKKFGRDFLLASEKIPGFTTEEIGKQAKECGVYVIVGMAELHPEITGTVYNSAVLIGPTGKICGVHRKIHIPGEEKHYFVPGNDINVFKTDIGNIGITICYDGQFPELTRMLALKGAEILCMIWNMPSFSNKPQLLEHYNAARAAENRMYAISPNRVGSDDGEVSFFGHSCISDPLGNMMAVASDEDEEIIYAELKRDILLEERAQMPIFRDRRPELYGSLSDLM